jgi:hypothetical protein
MAPICFGQAAPTVSLTITVYPTSDLTALSSDRSKKLPLPQAPSRVGRIVAVNGHPAAGSWNEVTLPDTIRTPSLSQVWQPTPSVIWTFDLAEPDRTPAGTIVAMTATHVTDDGAGELTIVSGTNAYLGVKGTVTEATTIMGSTQELTFTATLNPLVLPSIVVVPDGPAITHLDSSLVDIGHPADPGEMLTLYATDLVPQLGDSTDRLPVAVTVGIDEARIVYAGQYPGTTNGYQINFQLPQDSASGIATVRIVSGFIAGPPVQLAIR